MAGCFRPDLTFVGNFPPGPVVKPTQRRSRTMTGPKFFFRAPFLFDTNSQEPSEMAQCSVGYALAWVALLVAMIAMSSGAIWFALILV